MSIKPLCQGAAFFFFLFSDAIACLIMLVFVEGELLAGNAL